MNEIHFEWAGKKYLVKANAYDKDYIVLPNRKVLGNIKWLEKVPPEIELLEEIHHNLDHAPVGEIAEHFGNAILAHEAD